MRWHDAREVIPDEDEEVFVDCLIPYGTMRLESSKGCVYWEMRSPWVWIADGERYNSICDYPRWCYVEELYEELDDND